MTIPPSVENHVERSAGRPEHSCPAHLRLTSRDWGQELREVKGEDEREAREEARKILMAEKREAKEKARDEARENRRIETEKRKAANREARAAYARQNQKEYHPERLPREIKKAPPVRVDNRPAGALTKSEAVLYLTRIGQPRSLFTIRNAITNGRLEAIRIGREVYIDPAALARYLVASKANRTANAERARKCRQFSKKVT